MSIAPNSMLHIDANAAYQRRNLHTIWMGLHTITNPTAIYSLEKISFEDTTDFVALQVRPIMIYDDG